MRRIERCEHPNSKVWQSLVAQQDHPEWSKYLPDLLLIYEQLSNATTSSIAWQSLTKWTHEGEVFGGNIYYQPNEFFYALRYEIIRRHEQGK